MWTVRTLGFLCALELQSICLRPVEALLSRFDSAHSDEISRPSPYEVHYGTCSCDFRKLECLPSADCLRAVRAASDELISGGVAARQALKRKYRFDHEAVGQPFFVLRGHPLGKLITFAAISNWRRWAAGADMTQSFPGHAYSKYIDPKRYPDCINRSLIGSACFWQPFDAAEDLDEIEEQAVHRRGQQDGVAGADFEQFRLNVASAIVPGTHEQNDDILNSLPADQYLLSVAHIARIQFNMQPSLRDAYKKYRSVVNPGVGQLRVGVHIRRSDSCSELVRNDGYKMEASNIDAGPQMTNVRLCYHTQVYIDGLSRVKSRYGLPLAVYLSSDDPGSILDEIKSLSPDLFESSSWHHVSFAQDAQESFGYNKNTGLTVEFQDDATSALIGETAALDAWHLSHSEVFIGSLGSRFGKAAYLLAVSRHNVVVPYISVDGHSYCCQNDEQCSRATEGLTGMTDCLLFAPEIDHIPPNKKGTYWEDGVTIRHDRPVSERQPMWPAASPYATEPALSRPAGLAHGPA
mmetsp:Transcript_57832/g.154604  ORF Transcript_57832/g.154604 Transcript_57832/m.154604 type:complete len:521 (-) Transcript_57832:150-1712(-)